MAMFFLRKVLNLRRKRAGDCTPQTANYGEAMKHGLALAQNRNTSKYAVRKGAYKTSIFFGPKAALRSPRFNRMH